MVTRFFPPVGYQEPNSNQLHVTNRFHENSLVVSQQMKQEDQMTQYKENPAPQHNYLTTHDKNHFQKHLSIKGLNHHHVKSQHKFSGSDLQFCLSMYTDLDILDENNKFICNACTDKKKCEFAILNIHLELSASV